MVDRRLLWAALTANAMYLLVYLLEAAYDSLVNWSSTFYLPFLAVAAIPFFFFQLRKEYWSSWLLYMLIVFISSNIWVFVYRQL